MNIHARGRLIAAPAFWLARSSRSTWRLPVRYSKYGRPARPAIVVDAGGKAMSRDEPVNPRKAELDAILELKTGQLKVQRETSPR
jgi:hypothetical protein